MQYDTLRSRAVMTVHIGGWQGAKDRAGGHSIPQRTGVAPAGPAPERIQELPAYERVKKSRKWLKRLKSGPQRRPRGGGDPNKSLFQLDKWIPAFAGMTLVAYPRTRHFDFFTHSHAGLTPRQSHRADRVPEAPAHLRKDDAPAHIFLNVCVVHHDLRVRLYIGQGDEARDSRRWAQPRPGDGGIRRGGMVAE